jgi:hypothetical protein
MAGGWSLDITTSGPADSEAPQTTIDSGPSETIDSSSATFAFSASEQAAFSCKLDGGSYTPCTSPAIYTGLADGAHTFAVRATDPAGNVDASPASRSFTVNTSGTPIDPGPNPDTTPSIDRTPPQVSIGTVTVKRSKRSATVTFTATDDATATTCSLDGSAATACTSPVTLKKLRPGRHTLVVQATDAAGNRSEAATVTFKVKRKR